jgi:uncharacterized protein YdaU (DUF1376 family)
MFYYQHHIGDFIKDTVNLDDHQLTTYLRMLWVYYTEEKPFSNEVDDIAFAVRSDEKTVRLLLRHFFEKGVDKWHHNRCDREISEYHSKSEKARNSANARWNNANAMRTHSERNANATIFYANQEPRTNNQEPNKYKKRGTRLPADCLLNPEWSDFCKQERPDLVPHKVFEEFKDYWIAQPGQKGVKTDWDATWRNWIRRQNIQKKTATEERRNQMSELTRGLSVPKKPFWSKTEGEIPNVESKRLL